MLRSMMVLIGILVLLGCTSKEETALMRSYAQKIHYHKKLQKTEKIQLYENNVTKIMLTSTYLFTRTLDKNDTRDEPFIIGIHVEDETDEDLQYSLLLNGKEAKTIQKLNFDDPRLKELSFISEWGDYYLVIFPHVNSKKVTMVFESERYGKGTLHFAKVAKYVLTKKAL